MTSVQNHRLQLNGNKIKVFLFFVLFLLGSTQRIFAINKTDSTFKIAIILPFHYNDYNGANINRSNIMLDYFQGFYTALKEYQKKGLNVKLFIYDNEHDTSITKEILLKPELVKMDLIIAPILDEHLHLLNRFSSKKQIAVLSPFTAADSLFPKNPLFFNAAPSEKTKAETFFEYYRKNCRNSEIIVVKSANQKSLVFEKSLENLISGMRGWVPYRFVTEDEIENADSTFMPGNLDYLVYHTAENSKDIKNLTTCLDKQNANIEILAEYKPSVLKAVHYSKRNKYNIKILSSDFINAADSAETMREFKNNYKSEFSLNPSRYSIIGYDQASFISEIFLKYNRFKAADFVGDKYRFYSTRFWFKIDPHCNQNKGVFILNFNDNVLEEVNFR